MGVPTVEETKKKVAAEVKQLAKKLEKTRAEAEKLQAEQDALAKKKELTDQDKKRQLDITKMTKDYFQACQNDVNGTCGRITNVLKTDVPKDPKGVDEFHKGMSKWYVDMIEKEPGLDLGNGVSLSGELSIKDKKAMFKLSGSF
jgi:seryl-tRNA synthetase